MHIIRSITGDNFNCHQKFISTFKNGNKNKLKSNSKFQELVKNDRRSVVGFIQNKNTCLKLVKPISFHEYLRVFWRHSRIQKEVKGNYLLSKAGLRTAKIFDHGLGLPSLKNYKFLGFILMENLLKSGFDEAYLIFTDPNQTKERKDNLFKKIVCDVEKMKIRRFLFSDLHLKNILINSEDDIAYIDTGVSKFTLFKNSTFKKKFNQAMDKLARCHSNKNGLSEQQKKEIQALKF